MKWSTACTKGALQFAEGLRQIDGIEVLNEVVFNQVMIACKTDKMTDAVIEKVQEMRECWVGGSSWNGKRIIRISVCSWRLQKRMWIDPYSHLLQP